VASSSWGSATGGLALIGPVTPEAFGPRHFAVNFGMMFWAVAAASFTGPRKVAADRMTQAA